MKFPDRLDEEDMKLAIKEWRLAGLCVHERPAVASARSHTDLVYVRENQNRYQFLARYVYHRDGEWMLTRPSSGRRLGGL